MEKRYENYPAWIIIVCNLVPVSIYVIGAVILSGLVESLYKVCMIPNDNERAHNLS